MPKLSGITCGNFGVRSNGGLICSGAWCAICFHQDPLVKFPVLGVKDLDNSLVDEGFLIEDDLTRFMLARDGDHLMTPFQCENCHFFNMRSRPRKHGLPADDLLAICIRRATIDSFWSRERTTVSSNLRLAKRYLVDQEALGSELNGLPSRGPYPHDDVWGMNIACGILLKSLDKGRNAELVQYETIRRLRSMYSNFVHTCAEGSGASFVSDNGTGSVISNSPTNSLFFKRFMQGCHRRMGDVWKPDAPVTKDILGVCFEILEEQWEVYIENRDKVGQKKTALMGCMLVSGYYGALRGEEVNRVDLGGMNHYWTEASTQSKERKHVPLTLVGRFKQKTGIKFYTQPLAWETNDKRNLSTWFIRARECYANEGITTGPMFRNTLKMTKMSVAEMDVGFHELLRIVQRRCSNLIADSVNIEEDYSMKRSLRRGATAEAQNAEIPTSVIEANNGWRKFSRAKGMTPGMSMMQRYSDAKASVPTLIRFSRDIG